MLPLFYKLLGMSLIFIIVGSYTNFQTSGFLSKGGGAETAKASPSFVYTIVI